MKRFGINSWLITVVIALSIIGAFAQNMAVFNHDEHMYITASVLINQGQSLYKEFTFTQVPYLPWFYGTLFRVLNVDSFYLLIGKLVNFLFLCLSATILFFLSRRVLRDMAVSLAIVALFLLNKTIVMSAAQACNFIIPVALSIASFYVFIASAKDRINKPGVVMAGLLLALATGTKLTYAPIIIPFIVVSLVPFCKKNIKLPENGFSIAVCLIVGYAIGLLPMLAFMSDLDSFIFNNWHYHHFNTQWKWVTGHTDRMSLYAKIDYARSLFLGADNLAVSFGIILGVILSVKGSSFLRQAFRKKTTGACLAILLVMIALPITLVPTPTQHHYYVLPISFLFIVLIYAAPVGLGRMMRIYRLFLFVLVMAAAVSSWPDYFHSAVSLMNRENWIGFYVHDMSANLRDLIEKRDHGANWRIATLSPLFAVEDNLPIFPELSAGPFYYRMGGLVSPQQRKRFVMTSRKSIGNLFNAEPPAAILVGAHHYGYLEEPLIDYAILNHYEKVDLPGFRGDLYLHP